MKARPCRLILGEGYPACAVAEATHIEICIAGPFGSLHLPVILKGDRHNTPNWSWNGDVDKPTLKPSVKTENHLGICHTWVTDGKAFYHDDTTHELRGQTVDLIDV